MHEQDRHDLLQSIEELLVNAGPLLLRHDESLYRAAARAFARIVSNTPNVCDVEATRLYGLHVEQRHGSADTLPGLPHHARGQYPFDKPTKTLREALPAIEAMLGPLRACKGNHSSFSNLKARRDPT